MNKEDAIQSIKDHILLVRDNMGQITSDLTQRSLHHDQCKLETPEVEAFTEYLPRMMAVKFGTPEYEECRRSLGPALIHHYSISDHHPEYKEFNGKIENMNLCQLCELLSDWKAANISHASRTFEESLQYCFVKYEVSENFQNLLRSTARYLGWL